MNLSTKFSLMIMGLLSFTVFVLVGFNMTEQLSSLEEEISQKGTLLAHTTAISSIDPLLKQDFATLYRICMSIVVDEDVNAVVIIDKDGTIKMHSDLTLLGEQFYDKNSLDLKHSVVSSPLCLGEKEWGKVVLILTSEHFQEKINKQIKFNFILAFIIVILGYLIAQIMAKKITTPLKQLVEYAESIEEEDYDRIPAVQSTDEFGLLSRAFRIMLERLKYQVDARLQGERLAMAGELASIVAHEVRNPLEPIKGAVALLRLKESKSFWVQKYTTIIDEEVNQLADFTNNFLDLTRFHKTSFKRGNLNKLILSLNDLMAPYFADKGHQLELNLDPHIPDTLFDPRQIKQILMNLLLNSVQSVTNNDILVVLSSMKNNRSIILKVEDNGVGIDEKHLLKIKDSFFSTKADGVGLGFSICQNLVEQNRGALYIESQEGVGTCVRVELPIDFEDFDDK